MAHPGLKLFWQTLEKSSGRQNVYHGLAELPAIAAGNDAPSQNLGHELKPIADPEYRKAQIKKFRGKRGASRSADGIRSTRQYHSRRAGSAYLIHRGIEGNNLAVYGQLTNSTGDELSILATKIQNQDAFAVNGLAPG